MRLRHAICLLTLIVASSGLYAQTPDADIRARLAAAMQENATLKKLVAELTAMSKELSADIEAQRIAFEEINKRRQKADAERGSKTMDYKIALAENKMLKARIKSLLRARDSSTSKPSGKTRRSSNVKVIHIELQENFWKWWTDPLLLTEHMALRRKLVHLDGDHSIDAWLTRRKGFTGTRVEWNMTLVSVQFTSKLQIDKALKKANQDLTDTLDAVVHGKTRPLRPSNSGITDLRIEARTTSQPAPKPDTDTARLRLLKPSGYYRPKREDIRRQIGNLQESIKLYKRASAAGGLTTIHAVAGNVAAKMLLPGKQLEGVRASKRPGVFITGSVLGASPKAGFFAGRKDTMVQFSVNGECKLKSTSSTETKPE